jgi:hypothetical protein
MPPFSGYRLWLAIAAVGGVAALPPLDDRASRETVAARQAAAAAPAAVPPEAMPLPDDAASKSRLHRTEGKQG